MMATSSLVKDTGMTNTSAKSVKEYSCMEDSNAKFRPYMEDSNKWQCVNLSRVHMC